MSVAEYGTFSVFAMGFTPVSAALLPMEAELVAIPNPNRRQMGHYRVSCLIVGAQ